MALQRRDGPAVAPARIAVLEKLAARAGSHAAALGVFIGEELSEIRQYDEARQALGRALAFDPNLAAAWVSIGRTYPAQLRFAEAWRCWALATRLCPTHPVVRDVQRHQRALEDGHPDFF